MTKTGKFDPAPRRGFLKAGVAGLALGVLPGSLRTALAADGLKIGIVGSGRVGSALGELWLKAGHEVMFSSLNLEQDKALAAKLGGKARAGTSKEAAAFGEVVFLAVPYGALPQLGKDLAEGYRGKVLFDASNPFANRDGEIANWAREKGAGLATAELFPGARVVRGFNAIGAARLPAIAQDKSRRVGMPIAGDDAKAVEVASRLVRDAGLEPVLVGGLTMGKYLMPGTPLAGENAPDKVREVAATLK